jgi:predicted FMN-binding regulatory protein PaiB
MYIPPHFAVTDPAVLHRIIHEHPLGMLVTHGRDGLDAEHVPFEFDPGAGPLGTLTAHVARLTGRHEAAEPRPWKMSDLAPDDIDAMLRNIVGIEVTLTSLVGKSKLSQNKDARDRHAAADTLSARGPAELAQAMHDAG